MQVEMEARARPRGELKGSFQVNNNKNAESLVGTFSGTKVQLLSSGNKKLNFYASCKYPL